MSRFGCVRWIGWGLMACSLVPLSVRAQANNSCLIERGVGGTMYPNAPFATQLQSNNGESFFTVRCKGQSSGLLRLSINLAGTSAYGALVRFRLVSAHRMFTISSSDFTDGALIIPYQVSTGSTIGDLQYQVQVMAPGNRLLKAAKDYVVQIKAELSVSSDEGPGSG